MFKFFIAVLFLTSICYAANFGSSIKMNPIKIDENQTGVFSLLLWTSDETPQKIFVELISKPENWTVYSDNVSDISRNSGNEMIYAGGDYIHATSINVLVNPNGARAGKYSIIVSAKLSPSSGGITFLQERIFNMTLIIGNENRNVINIDVPLSSSPQSNYNFIFTVLIIIFISVMIYRYS